MRCLTEIQPAIKPAGWLASGEYRCFSPVIFWGDESYVIPTGLAATIRTAEAERIGLVSHVYPADVFGSSAASYLDDIRKRSRPCVRLPKRATMRATRAAPRKVGRAGTCWMGSAPPSRSSYASHSVSRSRSRKSVPLNSAGSARHAPLTEAIRVF